MWLYNRHYLILLHKGADLITVSADDEICLYDNFTLDSLLQLLIVYKERAYRTLYVVL